VLLNTSALPAKKPQTSVSIIRLCGLKNEEGLQPDAGNAAEGVPQLVGSGEPEVMSEGIFDR
jgi:hypothetical protein